MDRQQEILHILEETYGGAQSALHYGSVFQLLVAVILSAQTNDNQVNKITGPLFQRYPDAAAFATLEPADLEPQISTCGLYKNKAKNIVAASRILCQTYGGQVPADRDALMALPGVGRKTANVVLAVGFGIPRTGGGYPCAAGIQPAGLGPLHHAGPDRSAAMRYPPPGEMGGRPSLAHLARSEALHRPASQVQPVSPGHALPFRPPGPSRRPIALVSARRRLSILAYAPTVRKMPLLGKNNRSSLCHPSYWQGDGSVFGCPSPVPFALRISLAASPWETRLSLGGRPVGDKLFTAAPTGPNLFLR